MKKIDYYAVQHPWRMPKWLGATLGGIFGFILIVSGVAIVKLTRSPVAAVAAAPAATTPAAPAPAPAATAPAPATPAPAVAAAPAAAPAAPVAQADTGKHHKHHGKTAASHHAVASAQSAKKAKANGALLANAKHDSKKVKDKDALDKLLGI